MSAGIGDTARLLTKGYRGWLLTVLTIVCTFNYADRAILAVLVQPIKMDLKLTDFQIGLLQGLAFAVLYSVLGVPIGRLAERKSRIGIIGLATAAWSLMTALCGFTHNFLQLFLCRIGVGIGEAGFLAPVASLVGDHFPREKRASALAIITLGTPIGFLLGAIVGGQIVQHWNWRVGFFAFGIPGIIGALLVSYTLKEPPRGMVDGEPPEQAHSLWTVMKVLWAKPSFRQILIGGSIAGFGLNAVGQFTNPYLIRVQHLDFAKAGLIFGLISGFANGAGSLLGGFGSDWLGKRDPRWAAWFPALCMLITAPIYVLAWTRDSVPALIPLVFLGNMMLITFYSPTFGMVQNLSGPRMRASAVAVFSLVFSLIGAGFGPTVLGLMSDLFASAAFTGGHFAATCPGGMAPKGSEAALVQACGAASAAGLRNAMVAVNLSFVWAAVHYFLAARTLKADFYRTPAELGAA